MEDPDSSWQQLAASPQPQAVPQVKFVLQPASAGAAEQPGEQQQQQQQHAAGSSGGAAAGAAAAAAGGSRWKGRLLKAAVLAIKGLLAFELLIIAGRCSQGRPGRVTWIRSALKRQRKCCAARSCRD